MNTLRLALKSPFLPLNFALIFSPAFMLYPVFDPVGSFRKEIILFALLSSVCAHLAFSKKGISNGFLVLIGLSSVVMVLSHEMLVIYLPFLVCALILHEKGITVNTKKLIVALIPAILITIFIILFGKGNRHNVLDICNSLNLNTFSNCAKTGAIAFLGLDFKIAHEIVLEYSNSESRLVYILTAILSTLPIVIFVFTEKVVMFVNNRRMMFWLTFFILSTFISSLLFFWIAVDYGRLIYIPIACLSLLALLVISKRKEVTQKITAKSIIPWVLSLLFVTSWHLMHYLATINNSFPVFVTIRKLVTIIFHQ